ncbi:MAG: methionine adenosyltransferase [Candidatus Altiarchaeales archaeon]|nr:MAG: methionine adenosyltransferase [Candidatus Altiarchaeales archaeon]RLI94093.1 MAG: methionine adenosyltransferase [Candidatus Altiarchaeales archaeon]RLI95058.1 MAG: methionine adenosyltransferase [Candidatus Altiarchaeales archaeon]
MRNIVVEFPRITPIEKQKIELVERKGLGHPDSLCDGIAESVSRALCREYLHRYGRVLHHNTDQVELVGGAAKPEYGGGEMIRPVYILLGGRATKRVGNERIPIAEIAIESAREYLKNTLKNIEIDKFAEIDQRIGMGSADLQHIFEKNGIPKSNDTSFGVGYAPLSDLERIVLETEIYINRKLGMREVGEDVKVMGFRNGDRINLTIAAAMVSRYIKSLDHYISVIEKLHSKLERFVSRMTERDVDIYINTADDYEDGSVYLTFTGTSAEQGDDGSVGRGNRVNGLITPCRPVSLEAASGKNPVNHVGKIYNLLSREIAEEIAGEGAEEVHVRLMSQIGKPIDEPMIASINIVGDKKLKRRAIEIADYWLENITTITEMCIEGRIRTF